MKKSPVIHALVVLAFLATLVPAARAEEISLPKPGTMVPLSPKFDPPTLKGIKIHPDNPFEFEFILDKGGSSAIPQQAGIEKLIKYFLASLTVPEKDMWVNLSPYEQNRVVPESFGRTEMGRDLLAEDYILKQVTSSLMYPEDETGRKFWKRVYEEAASRFGSRDVPVNTFNKVWIMPESAIVYENPATNSAYVVESKLKVLLEEDYLALDKNEKTAAPTHSFTSEIVRQIVIPELTKEVNTGKNFAQLRQVYNSVVLAVWYKKKIRESILNQTYVGKNKITGIDIKDPKEKEKIYQRYLEAFKKGAYNYIKEEQDPRTRQPVPRKYFSGGTTFAYTATTVRFVQNDPAMLPQGRQEALAVSVKVDPSQTSTPVVLFAQTFEAKNPEMFRRLARFVAYEDPARLFGEMPPGNIQDDLPQVFNRISQVSVLNPDWNMEHVLESIGRDIDRRTKGQGQEGVNFNVQWIEFSQFLHHMVSDLKTQAEPWNGLSEQQILWLSGLDRVLRRKMMDAPNLGKQVLSRMIVDEAVSRQVGAWQERSRGNAVDVNKTYEEMNDLFVQMRPYLEKVNYDPRVMAAFYMADYPALSAQRNVELNLHVVHNGRHIIYSKDGLTDAEGKRVAMSYQSLDPQIFAVFNFSSLDYLLDILRPQILPAGLLSKYGLPIELNVHFDRDAPEAKFHSAYLDLSKPNAPIDINLEGEFDGELLYHERTSLVHEITHKITLTENAEGNTLLPPEDYRDIARALSLRRFYFPAKATRPTEAFEPRTLVDRTNTRDYFWAIELEGQFRVVAQDPKMVQRLQEAQDPRFSFLEDEDFHYIADPDEVTAFISSTSPEAMVGLFQRHIELLKLISNPRKKYAELLGILQRNLLRSRDAVALTNKGRKIYEVYQPAGEEGLKVAYQIDGDRKQRVFSSLETAIAGDSAMLGRIDVAMGNGQREYQEDVPLDEFISVSVRGEDGIEHEIEGRLIGVMDGASRSTEDGTPQGGNLISQFVHDQFPELFSSRLKRFLKQYADKKPEDRPAVFDGFAASLRAAFGDIKTLTRDYSAQTTASFAFIPRNYSEIAYAVLGNSPIVFVKNDGSYAVPPTHDLQNVEDVKRITGILERRRERNPDDEYSEIQPHGILIYDPAHPRNYRSTELTRFLGGKQFEGTVRRDPDTGSIPVADVKAILIGSDGILPSPHGIGYVSKLAELLNNGITAHDVVHNPDARRNGDNKTALIWHRDEPQGLTGRSTRTGSDDAMKSKELRNKKEIEIVINAWINREMPGKQKDLAVWMLSRVDQREAELLYRGTAERPEAFLLAFFDRQNGGTWSIAHVESSVSGYGKELVHEFVQNYKQQDISVEIAYQGSGGQQGEAAWRQAFIDEGFQKTEGDFYIRKADSAQAVVRNGGIDMNPSKVALSVQNAGQQMNFHVDPAMLQRLQNASGLVPTITRVQPISVRVFLGLEK